jgi:hypothetical protein
MEVLIKIFSVIISSIILPLLEKLITRQTIKNSETMDIKAQLEIGEKRLDALKKAKEALNEIAYNSSVDDI